MTNQIVTTNKTINPIGFIRKYDELFSRLLFLLGAIIIYRFGSHVPVPGIDPSKLDEFFNTNANKQKN